MLWTVVEVEVKLPLALVCGSAAKTMPVMRVTSNKEIAADTKSFFIGFLFLEAEIGLRSFVFPP
jgi:hypothetical protein